MMTDKIAVLIQARMSSSRLPGKVLLRAVSKPVQTFLEYQISRLSQLDENIIIGVVTSLSVNDDPIYDLCNSIDIFCYRGSEADLVDRYYYAAKALGIDIIIRLTGDCPLIDYEVVNQAIKILTSDKNIDYVSSTEPLPTSFPDGMDVWGFRFNALEKAHNISSKPSEREHVSPAFTNHKEKFNIVKIPSLEKDCSKYRICLDYKEDLVVIRELIAEINNNSIRGSLDDIVGILEERSDLVALNSKFYFGEGWKSSFLEDKKIDSMDAIKADSLVLKKTEELWKRQEKFIPGGAQTFSKMPNQFVNGVAPKLLHRGKNGRVWDYDGNEYLDFVSGLGAIILGHCHEEVDNAASECAKNIFSIPSLGHPMEADLSEIICSNITSAEMCRFGKNGSDATSGAVRLARGITGRKIIGTCGYHGWQDWFIGRTSRNKGVPECVGSMTLPFRYNDIESLEKIFDQNKNDVAAIIMEPVSFNPPKNNFLENVRELCFKNKALLIFDEMITGFRFGVHGAQSIFGVVPDLTCFGKAISNGYPLSVITGRREYMSEFNDVFYSFTYGGELPSISAAIKTIDILKSNKVPENIRDKGLYFIDNFNKICNELNVDFIYAKGYGNWPKYECKDTKIYTSQEILTLFQQELVRRGILIKPTVFICYRHSYSDLDRLLSVCRQAMLLISDLLLNNNLLNNIDGDLINTIIRDETIDH